MRGDAARRCVRCERDPGYNREVVDLFDGEAVGALCRNCELETIDDALAAADDAADPETGCALCDRDGFYALPKWLPRATRTDGVVVSSVDYERDDDPIQLCDEHYHEVVAGDATTAVPSARSARGNR